MSENQENDAYSDCGEENRVTKKPKRRVHSMSTKLQSSQTSASMELAAKALKRKTSAPLGDITNIKAPRLLKERDSTPKYADTVDIEVRRREVDRDMDELEALVSSPLSLPKRSDLSSHILNLIAYNRTLSQKLQEESNASETSAQVESEEVMQAAEALVDLSTPVKVS